MVGEEEENEEKARTFEDNLDEQGKTARLESLMDEMDAFAEEDEREDEGDDLVELYGDNDPGEEYEDGHEGDDDDDDDEDDLEEEKEEIDSGASEVEDENLDPDEEGADGFAAAKEEKAKEERLSEHTKANQKLRHKLDTLEAAQIAEKPWQLRGEVGSGQRPENSLLEEIVDFDQPSSGAIDKPMDEEAGGPFGCMR